MYCPRKLKKKPIEVIAYKYEKDTQSEIMDLMNRLSKEEIIFTKEGFSILKERGVVHGKLGDWVLYEINTDLEFWVIQEDIFYKTYDKVKSKPNLFIKSPIIVEGYKFIDFSDKCLRGAYHFLGLDMIDTNKFFLNVRRDKYIIIPTLEGDEKLFLNEWIIKGIDGEYYPVSEASFEKVFNILS